MNFNIHEEMADEIWELNDIYDAILSNHTKQHVWFSVNTALHNYIETSFQISVGVAIDLQLYEYEFINQTNPQ